MRPHQPLWKGLSGRELCHWFCWSLWEKSPGHTFELPDVYGASKFPTSATNAASIAGLLLTTECLITDVPEEEKPAPDHSHDHM